MTGRQCRRKKGDPRQRQVVQLGSFNHYRTFFFYLYIYLFVRGPVHVCVSMPQQACGGQSSMYKSHFSLIMWALGIEPRPTQLLVVVAHICNPSTWNLEAGGSGIPGQLGLRETLPQHSNKKIGNGTGYLWFWDSSWRGWGLVLRLLLWLSHLNSLQELHRAGGALSPFPLWSLSHCLPWF